MQTFALTDYMHILASCTRRVAPRGLETRELPTPLVYTFPAGRFVARKGLARRLAAAELLLILAGRTDPEVLSWAAPKADPTLFVGPISAYGPRIFEDDQLGRAVEVLRDDPSSRQAACLIIRPSDVGRVQPPCTVGIQWLIRDHALYATVWMRSWDLIKGLPYDMVVFGGLTRVLASVLGVPAGRVTVIATSAHYYVGDVRAVNLVRYPSFKLPPFGSLAEAREWAEGALARRDEWDPWPAGFEEVNRCAHE